MELQIRRVAELKPHPRQVELYGDLSNHEFQALKEDIATNGLRQPIEIAPDETVIDGHQRLRALLELGITDVEVFICTGLTDEEVDERFIQSNLLRRQLDPVAKARAVKALAEIEHRKQGKRLNAQKDEQFCKHLCEQLGGISRRTVDRYLQLLRLPRAIQDAVSAGQLPLTRALKIESLSKQKQHSIATRIAAGEPAKNVIAEFETHSHKHTASSPQDLYFLLVNFLDDDLEQLEPHMNEIAGTAASKTPTAELMERAIKFCNRMHDLELRAAEQELNDIRSKIGMAMG